MKLALIKTFSGLKPAYDSDMETYKKIPLDTILGYEVKVPRNIKLHRKFFALMKLVFDNQTLTSNPIHLRHAILIEAGYYDEKPDIHGEIRREAKSISFANMDEFEFNELYSRCIDVIIECFKFDRNSVEQEIANFY